jgi:hypothetical protein
LHRRRSWRFLLFRFKLHEGRFAIRPRGRCAPRGCGGEKRLARRIGLYKQPEA